MFTKAGVTSDVIALFPDTEDFVGHEAIADGAGEAFFFPVEFVKGDLFGVNAHVLELI